MSQRKSEAPPQLVEFQSSYSRFVRAPGEASLPSGIPPRRSRVYEELLFNNVCGFLDRCFPVARKILGQAEWRQLNRRFYRDWQCHTPYFSRIPHEFVEFARHHIDGAPVWLAELLDYEWRELEVDLHTAKVPRIYLPTGHDDRLALNPTLQVLQYHWPVHRISAEFVPAQEQPTFLLVYRTFDHQVRFVEVNALTSALLQIFQAGPASSSEALGRLAELMPEADSQVLFDFGKPLLLNLLQQNILILDQPAPDAGNL